MTWKVASLSQGRPHIGIQTKNFLGATNCATVQVDFQFYFVKISNLDWNFQWFINQKQ